MQISALNSMDFGAKTNTPDGRVERRIVVRNPLGMHFRPCSTIVPLANLKPDMDVFVSRVDNPHMKVDASSILSLAMLGAAKNDEIILNVPKNYPPQIYKAMVKILSSDDENKMTLLSKNCVDRYQK